MKNLESRCLYPKCIFYDLLGSWKTVNKTLCSLASCFWLKGFSKSLCKVKASSSTNTYGISLVLLSSFLGKGRLSSSCNSFFINFSILNNSSIRDTTIRSNITVQEFIICFHDRHQHQTFETLIIPVEWPASCWWSNLHVLSVNGAQTIKEIPFSFKFISCMCPFTVCCRKLKQNKQKLRFCFCI